MKNKTEQVNRQTGSYATVSEEVDKRHKGKVYFQHKIDRILSVLGPKLPQKTKDA